MNKEIEEMANGYYIENNKIVYFSNMLDGYKDEKSLQEVCNELNNFVKIFDSYCAKIDFLENKKKELENQLDAKCDKCINRDRKQAVKEFAEKLKNKLFDFFQENEDLDGKISIGILYIDIIGVEAKDGAIISLGLIDRLLKEYEVEE